MIIRPLIASDVQNSITLWNLCLTEDSINEKNFYNRIICDINFNPNLYLLAEENGELVGFAYGTKRIAQDEVVGLQTNMAWIVAMGVAPQHRRKKYGTELVRALEAALNVQKIELGAYATNYFFPGVDEKHYAGGIDFFKSLGYAASHTSVSMDLNLRDYQTPQKYLDKKAKLEESGYIFRSLLLNDTLPALEFLRKEFPAWLPAVRENILRGRGEETIQLAISPQGKVVGFAMRAMDGTDGRFGPFGVCQSQQGTGLGGVLFHNLISDMIKRRIFYTWFLWTSGRNLDIYATWGMKIYRTYMMMEKSTANAPYSRETGR